MHGMVGSLTSHGRTLARAGFMYPELGPTGIVPGPSIPLLTRGAGLIKPEHREFIAAIERGEIVGDLSQIATQLGATLAGIERGVSSGMTAFPVRENLEAEAKILVPMETPVRNMLPRIGGAGTASAWKQLTSLGGGWGAFADGTMDQPGGVANIRAFFSESITGSQAPAEHTSVYADKSAAYKLLGTFGSVTGFSMAAGANYQPQFSTEKTNALRNLMLNEEHALINGDATSVVAPWGDGTNALAFNGLLNLVTTANGTPAAQVATGVGPLTLSHIDAQLTRIWKQGGQGQWILMNAQEVQSMVHLGEASGSIIRVQASASADAILGLAVTGYKHPITGEIVPIMPSRFMPAGTILFGSKFLPDGSPAADVSVLPQVQLPELAPNENIQGYTAQELAPSLAAPQTYSFIVSVYQTLRLKSATVFAKSAGVTAV